MASQGDGGSHGATAAQSGGWEKVTPEVHLVFQLGEKAEKGGEDSKYTSLKPDTDEWFKSLLVLQKLNAYGGFLKVLPAKSE